MRHACARGFAQRLEGRVPLRLDVALPPNITGVVQRNLDRQECELIRHTVEGRVLTNEFEDRLVAPEKRPKL